MVRKRSTAESLVVKEFVKRNLAQRKIRVKLRAEGGGSKKTAGRPKYNENGGKDLIPIDTKKKKKK